MKSATITTAMPVIAIGGLLFLLGMSAGYGAEGEEYTPKAESRSLVSEPLPGDESKTVIIKQFKFPPGYVGARHSHTGAVYVYVLDGELTLEMEGSGPQTVAAGELFREPLKTIMHASNKSTDKGVSLIVFQVGETGKPMMLKAE